MKEVVENFGKYNHLCGTLCAPGMDPEEYKSPCVIMLNSGLVYQAGPNRLYVEMARDLAKCGFSSFRFDLSGIGDSNRSRESVALEEQIPNDIDEALAFIEEKTGIKNFVLMGICTGADNAHKYALRNSSVTGAIFMDGYAYKTPGYYLRYYGPRIVNPIVVARRLSRLFLSKPKGSGSSPETNLTDKEGQEGYFWAVPPKEKTIEELRKLVDQKVVQLHIYTRGWEWCFNHLSQFKSMYREIDFRGLATCVYFGRSDHTYTLIDERQALVKTVTEWMETQFKTSS